MGGASGRHGGIGSMTEEREPSPIPYPHASARQVLIVEDEARLREMLTRAVREMGFEATAVGSAEAALRLMAHTPHELILLDLNLPGMHGLELLKTIRVRWPNREVIVLTGFGDLEAAKSAIHLDVVDFLTKPCTLDHLEVALDRARSRCEQRLLAASPPAPQEPPAAPVPPAPVSTELTPGSSLEDVERTYILAALQRHNGNRAAAAAELGISIRTLYYRLGQYHKQGYIEEAE